MNSTSLSSTFLDPLPKRRALFAAILAARIFLCCLGWLAIDRFIQSDTYLATNIGTIVLASVLGTRLAFSRLTFPGFALITAAICGGVEVVEALAGLLGTGSSFPETIFEYHATIATIIGVVSMLSTWCFWRYRHAITWELLALGGATVSLLARHRDFRLDMVKVVNELAWTLGVQPFSAFIGLSCALCALLGLYLTLATIPETPTPSVSTPRKESRAQRHWGNTFIATLLFGVLIIASGLGVHRFFEQEVQSRTSNGVRSESEKGLSPLDFKNSIGGSRYPTALLRLESDYNENPFSQMLFLRESALSDLQGNEMLISGVEVDSDVAFVKPGQSYRQSDKADSDYRVPVTQSIYLLTPHELVFGIDRPVAINALRLPEKNERFIAAFKVYSMAPSFPLGELDRRSTGNPNWTEDERRLYLKTHADERYRTIANTIAEGQETEAGKAFAIANYLVKNAIYTLTPNHQVEGEDQDKTAPFLFGDMRGYCVHFAHASVYMLRALGIPARIGTGYLTDFSQSKDGHIVLRNSDRHAWAEVYFEGLGWIPFDVQPEQVENHADAPVDQDQLEELMGALEPGEEILPDDLEELEPSLQEEAAWKLPSLETLLAPVLIGLLALLLLKAFALHQWRLPAPLATRILRAFRASSVRLRDLGFTRLPGETLEEFSKRLACEHQLHVLHDTQLRAQATYAPNAAQELAGVNLEQWIAQEHEGFSAIPAWKRRLSTLNPVGLGYWIAAIKERYSR